MVIRNMLAEAHRRRAAEIDATIHRLRPQPGDVASLVELVHGAAHQYAAAFLLTTGPVAPDVHSQKVDKHQAIAGELDRAGRREEADAFRRIQQLRAGRWYGGQGNGEVTNECLELLEKFRRLPSLK